MVELIQMPQVSFAQFDSQVSDVSLKVVRDRKLDRLIFGARIGVITG